MRFFCKKNLHRWIKFKTSNKTWHLPTKNTPPKINMSPKRKSHLPTIEIFREYVSFQGCMLGKLSLISYTWINEILGGFPYYATFDLWENKHQLSPNVFTPMVAKIDVVAPHGEDSFFLTWGHESREKRLRGEFFPTQKKQTSRLKQQVGRFYSFNPCHNVNPIIKKNGRLWFMSNSLDHLPKQMKEDEHLFETITQSSFVNKGPLTFYGKPLQLFKACRFFLWITCWPPQIGLY